ncbi:MAG: helix-turn-helix domain-containing protein [Granulosicoccus sp.]|nr:helix-turn-helix domain-containing protein [Granulosicoccus sp.]
MPSNHTDTKLVVFVVYPDFVLLDLVGPLQVFTHAINEQSGASAYSTVITSIDGGSVSSNTVVPISTEPLNRFLNQSIHTLVIIGGDGAYQAMRDDELINTIVKLGSQVARICSVCSGALILAAAGFLNGKRAVTHWEDCDQLQTLFPEICVELDPIYVKDGNVWTSAGITTGMDMALAIVTEDLGRSAALKMARSIVVPMIRSGGQSQFSTALRRQINDSAGQFDELHAWIKNNLHLELYVEQLAAKVNMSARNFSRRYTSQMKMTPAKAVEAIRVEAARDLLEMTNMGVSKIAAQCGFRDHERLRRAFLRVLNTSPAEYRRQFKAVAG